MPILEVEIVCRPDEHASTDLASKIADAAGEVLRSRPKGTWVRLRRLDRSHYAENAGGPDEHVDPVFVSVLKHTNQEPDGLQQEAAQLAAVIGEACGRSAEVVHIVYEAQAAGRIAFGGNLIR